jgi:hypothetical protein
MSGKLINIGGKTNSGKSSLAVTMAKNAILNGWMVAGNESFRKAFPYPTLADVPLDDEHDFDVNLRLAIFDDAERGATLKPVIQRLLAYGTHVVTVTQAPYDHPVVSIAGQMGAEEVSLEVIEICRLLGVKLLLPPETPGSEGACCGKCRIESDLSGRQQASPEEAEQILGNTAMNKLISRSCPSAWRVGVESSQSAGHAGDAKPERGEQVTTTVHDNSVLTLLAKRLNAAGYIFGQTYAQCRSMALWHPGMAVVMESITDKGLFSLVTGCIAQSDLHDCQSSAAKVKGTAAGEGTPWILCGDGLLHHHAVQGKSGDGMSYPNREASRDMHNFLLVREFTRDLHDFLVKHAAVVNAPTSRRDGVQIAVSQKIVEMLSQSGDTSSYINNLRRFDVNQRE